MNQHHYERIDRGMKRQIKQDARRQPISTQGRFLSVVSAEKRLQVILAVPEAIRSGKTIAEIANDHEVNPSTLKAWLIGDDVTAQARGEFLSHEVTARAEQIDLAEHPLALARAREAFKAWSWIAERREARLFGQKQEVTHKGQVPVLNITIVNNSPVSVDSQSPILDTGVMSSPELLPNK